VSKEIAINTASPRCAYRYALHGIQGRFPEGEEIIATDATYSYLYARFVLDGSFSEGEEALSRHGRISYLYAKNVLEGRFHEGEAAILGSLFAEDYFKKVFLPNIKTVDKKNPSDVELKFLSMMI